MAEIDRRHLHDVAAEGGQRGADRRIGRPRVAGAVTCAVGVVGVARLAEAQGEAVGSWCRPSRRARSWWRRRRRPAARRSPAGRACRHGRAFCASKARLTRFTTSVEPMPAGLSMISQPSSGRPRGLRWRCAWGRSLPLAHAASSVGPGRLRGRAPPPAAASPRRSAWRSRARCRAGNAGRARTRSRTVLATWLRRKGATRRSA